MSEYDFLADFTAEERCHYARFTPLNTSTNADVDGTAVTAAFFVTIICSLTQAFSSPVHGFLAYLVQNYFILIGTLWSIHRREFSPFDVTFVLRLTSPPHNLVILVILVIFSWRRPQIIRCLLQETNGLIALILGGLFPFLWLGLALALRYSNHALTNGKLCEDAALWGWILDICGVMMSSSSLVTPLTWVETEIVVFWGILFIYLAFNFLLGLAYLWAKWAPLNHISPMLPEWFAMGLLLYILAVGLCMLNLECMWAFSIMASAIAASGKNYSLTYGQMLSILGAVPSVLPTAKPFCSFCWNLVQRIFGLNPTRRQLRLAYTPPLRSTVDLDRMQAEMGQPLLRAGRIPRDVHEGSLDRLSPSPFTTQGL